MTLRQVSIDILDEVLLVPRIIVGVPIGHFAKKYRFDLVKGHDDLDAFKAIALSLEKTPFTLSHHASNRKGETTISLPIHIATVRDIDAIFNRIADELGIDDATVVWRQGHDDPPRKFA